MRSTLRVLILGLAFTSALLERAELSFAKDETQPSAVVVSVQPEGSPPIEIISDISGQRPADVDALAARAIELGGTHSSTLIPLVGVVVSGGENGGEKESAEYQKMAGELARSISIQQGGATVSVTTSSGSGVSGVEVVKVKDETKVSKKADLHWSNLTLTLIRGGFNGYFGYQANTHLAYGALALITPMDPSSPAFALGLQAAIETMLLQIYRPWINELRGGRPQNLKQLIHTYNVQWAFAFGYLVLLTGAKYYLYDAPADSVPWIFLTTALATFPRYYWRQLISILQLESKEHFKDMAGKVDPATLRRREVLMNLKLSGLEMAISVVSTFIDFKMLDSAHWKYAMVGLGVMMGTGAYAYYRHIEYNLQKFWSDLRQTKKEASQVCTQAVDAFSIFAESYSPWGRAKK